MLFERISYANYQYLNYKNYYRIKLGINWKLISKFSKFKLETVRGFQIRNTRITFNKKNLYISFARIFIDTHYIRDVKKPAKIQIFA